MGTEGGPAGAAQDGGSIEDERLWTVFQGLVDDHGRTRAARVLGVTYRTVVANLEAGQLSRRMRRDAQSLCLRSIKTAITRDIPQNSKEWETWISENH